MNIKKYKENRLKGSTIDNVDLKKSIENAKNYSVSLLFKQYVYSFMFWIYNQNPEYKNYLNAEEISNYFLHQIKHPFWFQLLTSQLIETFDYIVLLDDSFNQYLGENIFDYLFEIHPLDAKGEYKYIELQDKEMAGKELLDIVKRGCKKYGYKICDEELYKMTKLEAEATISILLKVLNKN